MKHLSGIICMLFILQTGHSQSWTWVNGNNINFRPGVYGSKGVASPTNLPGSRGDVTRWTDKNGNFWLFGGLAYDVNNSNGFMNDLWKWDGTNWIWISGSNVINATGVYGTKGIAASTNVPSARGNAQSWVDTDGNLWMFGGQGNNNIYYNDLWKWDGINWTWENGSNTYGQLGIYGTKGIANVNNVPGARDATCGWVDDMGNFWLFGGDNPIDRFNDLWKWDGANWTWMSGSSSPNQNGIYGIQNTTASTNVPGARNWPMSWKDKSGNLWLFGGHAYPISGSTPLFMNDLWKWDGTNWTWMSGRSSGSSLGVYGTKGVATNTNVPGSRYGSCNWTDKNGNFWLFGGYAFDQSGNTNVINDLWEWNGSNWIWINGSNFGGQTGIYGTKGVASITNVPGARSYPVSWSDNVGNLWLFGGFYWNDLWKFDLSASVLPISISNFTVFIQNDMAILNWATLTETNNKGFIIEKSADAVDFKSIGWINGHGTTTQPQNYTYRDVQPFVGKNYYRFKQTDLDGHFTYSSVVKVDNTDKSHSIKVFPNPAENIINVTVKNITGELKIVDMANKLIKAVLITGNTMVIDVRLLASGTYVCKVDGASAFFIKK